MGSDYSVLSEYINSQTNLDMKHNICGHIYSVRPNNFLAGKRCPQCKGGVAKAHSIFANEIKNKYGEEYKILNEYSNSKTHILVKHKTCSSEYYVNPDNLLRHGGCAICSGVAKITTEEYKNRIHSMVGEEFVVLGEYINSGTAIEMFHKKCNRKSFIIPDNAYKYKLCNYCSETSGELQIRLILEQKNISFEQEKSFSDLKGINGGKLRFDFYLNYHGQEIVIEFDGLRHYEDIFHDGKLDTVKSHDAIKNKYAKDHNMKILRIPYWEIKNLRDILNNFLEDKTEHSYAHGED